MKLRHLRAFVAVADTGSFVGAARTLRLVQAALSKQVAALESEVGAPLFVRDPRQVHLTLIGEALIGEARRLVELSDAAILLTRAAADRAAGSVRLAHTELLGSHEPILAAALAALEARHPAVEVVTCRMSSAEQWLALRRRQIQVGVGYGEPADPTGIEHAPLAQISFASVLLPEQHPLATKRPLHLEDLADVPLILFPREVNPPLYDSLVAGLTARGLHPRMRLWMHLRGAHEAAVRAGLGWMLCTSEVTQRADGVAVCPITDPPLGTALSLWWAEGDVDPAVRAFVETALDSRRLT